MKESFRESDGYQKSQFHLLSDDEGFVGCLVLKWIIFISRSSKNNFILTKRLQLLLHFFPIRVIVSLLTWLLLINQHLLKPLFKTVHPTYSKAYYDCSESSVICSHHRGYAWSFPWMMSLLIFIAVLISYVRQLNVFWRIASI